MALDTLVSMEEGRRALKGDSISRGRLCLPSPPEIQKPGKVDQLLGAAGHFHSLIGRALVTPVDGMSGSGRYDFMFNVVSLGRKCC
jgi:hypothetical protein